MRIYPWDEETREALPPVEKPDDHPNPIGRCETDTPIPDDIPADHTALAILSPEGWFDHWTVVIDRRGVEYWRSDGASEIINEIGEDVPTGTLATAPPSHLHTTHDGVSWVIDLRGRAAEIRWERKSKLTTVYTPAIQQLSRWIDEAEGNPAAQIHYKTQRTAWHKWADALCDLPDQDGFPWIDGDVPWPDQPPKPKRYTP